MEIIPVIDVLAGRVVRAVGGERARYEPLSTPLAPASSDPAAIARVYRQIFPFPTLYVADLDGIEGRGADEAMQHAVAAAWGGDGVWIDDGRITLKEAGGKIAYVVGSESLVRPDARGTLERGALSDAAILSLDFRGNDFLGPTGLLSSPHVWPQRVIVMTLAAVGRDTGPDLECVAAIVRAAGSRCKVYAAGGVRGMEDIAALAGIGACGVLVASALHAGQIKTGDLHKIAG